MPMHTGSHHECSECLSNMTTDSLTWEAAEAEWKGNTVAEEAYQAEADRRQ